MAQYPPGAGPTAGQYRGAVYVPGPAQNGPGEPGGPQGSIPLALVANAALVGGKMLSAFVAPPTVNWAIRRITVQSSVVGPAYCYIGSLVPENIVSGTLSGDFDENDANQPYIVPSGQAFSVVWPSGGVCVARIEYVEV